MKLLLAVILFIMYDVLFHPFFILKTFIFIAFLYIFGFVHFFLIAFYKFEFLLFLISPFFNQLFDHSISFRICKIVFEDTCYFHSKFINYLHCEIFDHKKSKDYFHYKENL